MIIYNPPQHALQKKKLEGTCPELSRVPFTREARDMEMKKKEKKRKGDVFMKPMKVRGGLGQTPLK